MAPAGGIAEAIRKPANRVPADSILTDSRTEWGNMQTKQCTQCKETKELSCFNRRPRNSNGLRAECKSCVSENNRAYRAANAKQIIQYRKKYWAANKKRLAGDGKFPPTTIAGKPTKEYLRDYSQANKERLRVQRREYLRRNPGLSGFYSRRYQQRLNNLKFFILPKEYRRLKSSSCFYCGGVAKTVDHIIPVSKGGQHSVGNLVSACQSCNASKGNRFLYEWKIIRRKQERPLLFDLVERIEK